jgi:hypothetical protein
VEPELAAISVNFDGKAFGAKADGPRYGHVHTLKRKSAGPSLCQGRRLGEGCL